MTFTATWTQQDEQGRIVPGQHFIRRVDCEELAAEINRRRRIACWPGQDYSASLSGMVRRVPMDAMSGDADFRHRVAAIVAPAPGGFGGEPATPMAMAWLWPIAGDDEGKAIVMDAPGEGEVSLIASLGGGWADAGLLCPTTPVRAIQVNQVRQAMELLTRGRWELPIYFSAGIFSVLPDAPWIAGCVGNFDDGDELRAAGFFTMRRQAADSQVLGLCDVQARPGSFIEITADTDCTLELYRSMRPMDFSGNLPTWRRYDQTGNGLWQSPGGLGGDEAELLGELALAAGVPERLASANVTSFLNGVSAGTLPNLLVRRGDIGLQTVAISGRIVVEFDLA